MIFFYSMCLRFHVFLEFHVLSILCVFNISIYDKRESFNFHIINFTLSHIRPPMAYFYLTAYTLCPGMLIWMFYAEGGQNISCRFLSFDRLFVG